MRILMVSHRLLPSQYAAVYGRLAADNDRRGRTPEMVAA
jgi:hypothetical protein